LVLVWVLCIGIVERDGTIQAIKIRQGVQTKENLLHCTPETGLKSERGSQRNQEEEEEEE
jgi:hypothetical protein